MLRPVTNRTHEDQDEVPQNPYSTGIGPRSDAETTETPTNQEPSASPEQQAETDTDPDDSAPRITGRVVSWLERTPDGAVVMGDIYPPGHFALIPCPADHDPNALLDTTVTGNHVGRFHAPEYDSISYDLPSTAGVYLIIHRDKCR